MHSNKIFLTSCITKCLREAALMNNVYCIDEYAHRLLCLEGTHV